MSKSLVIVIAEGSEQDALYPNLKKIGEKLRIHFEIMGTDVFTAKENVNKSPKAIVGDIINEVTSKPEFSKNDIKLVIQLTDTDGVYITDDKIITDEFQQEKTHYTLENIRVNNSNQLRAIKNRNGRKRTALNTLSKTEKVSKTVNYKILYFSRNLDHVISDKPETPKSEKSKEADVFSNSFATSYDFENFFIASDFTVDGTYDVTWNFIKDGTKSLNKHSNFHLIFEMLRGIGMEFKPFPIGVDNFEKMINQGYYYVDKTLLIKELIDKKSEVNVFTRPRRFGKSLNISMLQYYFENLKADKALIFDSLKIMDIGDKYHEHQNKYPVIKLSLKGGEGSSFQLAFIRLKIEIGSEFRRHRYLLKNDKLNDEEKKFYQEIINKSLPSLLDEKLDVKQDDKSAKEKMERELAAFSNSLKFLSNCLERYYNKKVIILIDEYDVPLEKAYFRGFYSDMIDFLRSFYQDALKTNDSLNFAVLTGCLRVSKESIFTGLNNLDIISIVSNDYGEYFGFTESEMSDALVYYKLEEKEAEARDWYNGYLFGDTIVYNPWSSLKYMKDMHSREPFPKPHWSNTSSNSIIRELIAMADDEAKDEIEHLMAGGTITKPIQEDIIYAEIMENTGNLWNFLFFTGYLKKVSKSQRGEDIYLELKIPNREINYIYNKHIGKWFDERVKEVNMTSLYTAVLDQDIATFEDEIINFLGESISYMDSHENFYHGFLTGILRGITGYRVTSNRESGNGRGDIFMRPRDLRKTAVIIEVKIANKPQHLEKESENALVQIEKKKYDEELMHEGYTQIIKYGISFYRKLCMIKV